MRAAGGFFRSIRHTLWPLVLLVLCDQVCFGHSCMIDPLAPIGWVTSGISAAASGVKTVVTGTAGAVKGAYNLANPTEPPIIIIGGTASEPPKSGYAPMGCFRDQAGKRELPHIGGSGRKMNKGKCSSLCAIFASKYFGMQSSLTEKGVLECWCGNFYGKYGAGTKYDCPNRCPGEEEQTFEPCGGELFNSVYQIKK